MTEVGKELEEHVHRILELMGEDADREEQAVPGLVRGPGEGEVRKDGEREEHQEVHHFVRLYAQDMLP